MQIKSFFKNKIFHLSIFVFSVAILIYFNNFFNINKIDYIENKKIKKQFSLALETIESNFKKINSENLIKNLWRRQDNYFSDLNKKGIFLLIYKNDSLCFWTNNSFKNDSLFKIKENKIFNNESGCFFAKTYIINEYKIIYILTIRRHYFVENNYLKSHYNYFLKIPEAYKIYTNCDNCYKIKIDKKNTIFFKKVKNFYPYYFIILNVILFLFALFSLLIYLLEEYKEYSSIIPAPFVYLCICIIIISLRYLSLYFSFPKIFYTYKLFNPSIYATSYIFPSLGDFFINATLIFYLSYLFSYKIYSKTLVKYIVNKEKIKYLLTVFVFTALLFFTLFILKLIIGLVEHSNIPFDIFHIYELNIYTLISLISAILLLLSFLMVTYAVIKIFFVSNTLTFIILLILSSIFYTIFSFQINSNFLAFFGLFIILLFYFYKKKHKSFRKNSIVILFFSSVFISFLLLFLNIKKEKENRILIAEKLSIEKDPVAEFLFSKIAKKIAKDKNFINNLSNYWEKKKEMDKYLIDKYFSAYWNKYDINFTVCRSNDSIIVAPDNVQVECLPFFMNKIKNGVDIEGTGLYRLSSENAMVNYIGKIMFFDENSAEKGPAYLFIEFFSKFFPKGVGYPELLLSEKENKLKKLLENYSYAKYLDNDLIAKSGNFAYPISINTFKNPNYNTTNFYNYNSYSHLFYKTKSGFTIVVSKANLTFTDKITNFTYLFILTILINLFASIFKAYPFAFSFSYNTLQTKIQFFLILTLSLSLIIFSVITVYYIKNQYQQKNRNNLTEKLRSITVELQHKLGKEEYINNISSLLIKFSNVFFTDINLYATNGELIASSRPSVFENGLIGNNMHPRAFKKMVIDKNLEFINNERIGNLTYMSVYFPFINDNNELLAYINLPYFAKQRDLSKEISSFLVALVNVYTILFLIAIIISFLFSNYIIMPLRFIQTKMANVRLGKQNEKIEWKGKDELAKLVEVYNEMLMELEKSAEQLARSERESAWREMAKQVAHEIKNPLTPMRLNVQLLKRSIEEGKGDIKARINKTADILIKQIDTLSSIANAFSDFAKMPKTEKSKIEIIKIISNCVELFKNNKNVSINIKKSQELEKNIMIFGDKEQLLRVFNNLIKNSIQSVDENKEVVIDIKISVDKFEKNIIIEIKDNGSGIPYELREKIFLPNFTTKSGGMGLGLAICKNIIENHNGKIYFESEIGKGTSFFVVLPYS